MDQIEDDPLYPGNTKMDSQTDLGSILGAVGNIGTSYFNSETATNAAKLTAKQQLALAGQTANAQKTILTLGIIGAVIVAIIVVLAMLRKK